jgi:hypothetical protein
MQKNMQEPAIADAVAMKAEPSSAEELPNAAADRRARRIAAAIAANTAANIQKWRNMVMPYAVR